MSDPAIELHSVGKRYWQLNERAMLLKSILPFSRPQRTELWAVRDLSASIGQGETVGILGRNGAGKTSLLRLLAGVSRPSEGQIKVRGRVAPLISVGVGFHQEMSGRENVFVNGMLLGLTRAGVAKRFDEIVAFSELEDFIDTPVKFYSSGMYMRLGFSVASHVDPDVMLVDEILAVGDVAFQLKCIDRMRLLQRQGATIVLVSHSMHVIRLLCPRTLLMRRGRLNFDGDSETAISRHHELLTADAQERTVDHHVEGGAGAITIVSRQLMGPRGLTNHPSPDEPVKYSVRVRFERVVESPQFMFRVMTEEGTLAYGMQTTIGRSWRRFEPGDVAQIDVAFRPRLGGGTYRLLLIATDINGLDVLCHDPNGLLVYIAPRLGSSGFADLEASLTFGSIALTSHDELLLASPSPPRTAFDDSGGNDPADRAVRHDGGAGSRAD